jgi:hypothetical protein
MSSNEFSKEERVAFDNVIEGFEDGLVASKNVKIYGTDGQLMERTSDTIWRPQQFISVGQDRVVGSAVSAKGKTQLSVPATLGYQPNDTFELDALELRDALQEGRLGEASKNYLASRINSDVLAVATQQATVVVTVSTAAGDYDDIALCDTVFNEQGVPADDRFMMLNSRDYNGMAGNLAARQTMAGLPEGAYRRSYVGQVAEFQTFKLDSGRRIAATTATGITMDTQASAGNYYVPVATRVSATGEKSNVDNRYQTITVSSTTNVNAGDCFTVDGIEAMHHINKTATGQPKTYRVISVDSSTTMTISPPIISNQGGSDAEEQYQNCEVVTESGTAALTFLNVDATGYNVFWRKPAIELLPGGYAVPTGQGAAVMKATTANGIEIVMTKRFDPDTFLSRFWFDCRYGVCMTGPEQAGILLFNQSA